MPPYNEKNVYVGKARLKASDVRTALSNRNIDPAIIHTFEALCDNDKTQRDQIMQLATMCDNLIDHTNKMIQIMTKIKESVPDIEKMKAFKDWQSSATEAVKSTAREAIKMHTPEET